MFIRICAYFFTVKARHFFLSLPGKGKEKMGEFHQINIRLFIFSKRVDVIFSSVCDKETPKGSGHCMSTIWKIFTKWCDSGWTMSICNISPHHKPPMCKIMARQILLWSIHYICTFSLGDTCLSGNWKHRGVDFLGKEGKVPECLQKDGILVLLCMRWQFFK